MRRPPLRALLTLVIALGACADSIGPSGNDPLEVAAIIPAPGAVGIDVLTQVTLTFTRDIGMESVPGTITFHAGEHRARGTVWRQDSRTLVILPMSPLDFGTTYTVTAARTLADADGTPLGEEFTSTFTTRGSAPPSPDVDQLREFVAVLAHDSLRGRGSGTEDEARAANYIATLFSTYGLAAPTDDYIQAFRAEAWQGGMVDSRNVLGTVAGAGSLADEWLVVGGHYDHVGVRPVVGGSVEVHNGADDNASGTAAVMELARLYSSYVEAGGTGDQARRSVMFAAWGAEEKGLLGSCAFAESGLLSMDQTMATINFDMVGRMNSRVVQVHGPQSSTPLTHFVADANRPELNLLEDPNLSCASCSDHACFRDAGVPYVWFFTGMHEQYHGPDDDYDLIEFDGTADIAEIAFRLLTRLAITPEALAFNPTF